MRKERCGVLSLSKLDERGRTCVPEDVLKRSGIKVPCFLRWRYDEEQGVLIAEIVKDPYISLKGRYRDEELTYDKVEHQADTLLKQMHVSDL